MRIPFLRTSADYDDAHHELVCVTISTASADGFGFAWVPDTNAGRSVQVLLDDVLLPHVRNRRAEDVVKIWHEFENFTHRMGTGINRFAMAAIDMALWDLRAQQSGRSLADELGRVHDAIPVYGSGKAGVRLSTEELAQLSAQYVAEGFRAVKVRVGLQPESDLDRLRAVRQAVGEEVLIMTDANERFSLAEALHWGRTIAEAGAYWLEEPLPAGDVAGYERLSRVLPLAIVGGEHFSSAGEFVTSVRGESLAVLQPNVSMVGGITEIMRIARLAELHGLGFSPHALTPIHVHVAAASSASTYLEYFPFLDPFLEKAPEIQDGRLPVPSGPGHGVRFSADAIARYRTV